MNFTAIREVQILKEVAHPNIVQLEDVLYSGKNLFIVYKFEDSDLSKVIGNKKISLNQSIIKGILLQILQGMSVVHKLGVLHRDIKPENILVDRTGVFKIADFGMSRFIGSPNSKMTQNVVTSWFRPPEIFFGAQFYSFAVDIWSIGCIFAEMLLREPLFAGNSEMEVMQKIFLLLGVPDVIK